MNLYIISLFCLIKFNFFLIQFQFSLIQFENLLFIQFNQFFNHTALHIACQNNNAEIVRLLLLHDGIDVNKMYVLFIIE